MSLEKKYSDFTGKCLCKNTSPFWITVTTETREGKGLWERCTQCNLVINRSGVTKEKLKEFYNKQYQQNNSFTSGKKVSPREHYELAMHSMKPVADVIKPYLNKNMRVLDIGAATGELLDCIKEDVSYCFGIELNEEYCNFINYELGIDTSNQDYFDINFDQPFDLIIVNSTLDHMYNSLGVLEKIYDDLIPGGLLYIQTPNDEQALKNYLPEEQRLEFQKFMYQKAHYLSFSSSTLQLALKQRGFTVKNLFSRHDYTFKNFLNWYFVGKRQLNIEDAKINCTFFNNRSKFENEMNAMLEEVELKFQNIISRNLAGELLCCFAQRN